MKQQIINIEKHTKLPISVEEEYQFNNQMFQISDIIDNYYNVDKEVVEETIIGEEGGEVIKKYEVFNFNSENSIISKNKFEEKDRIRVKFINTNDLDIIKIKLNNKIFDLRTIQNESSFIQNSIPMNVFVILEYQSETIEKTITKIVDTDDGSGGIIPIEDSEVVEETSYFFKIKYIENLNCDILENNYNMYYKAILASVTDFEKKYSRNILDRDYNYYIDSITQGDIILPLKDVRAIDKICYLTSQLNEETEENEIVEKEIDSSYFEVYKIGTYKEQTLIKTSKDFETPEDILNDGSIESEMPYVIYFSVGFKDNIFPDDLKLALMNDVQFKLSNRGSEILVLANKNATTTDFCKNVFKNYKQMII